MSLVVPPGETVVVDTNDVASAGQTPRVSGTLEVRGTLQTVSLELQSGPTVDSDTATALLRIEKLLTANGVDTDDATGILTRLRTLLGEAEDADTTATTLELLRILAVEASDADEAPVDLFAGLLLAATATDGDVGEFDLFRSRLLNTNAADEDACVATTERVKFIAAEASDIDASQTKFLPLSDSTDARQAAKDILEPAKGWPNDPPGVFFNEAISPKAKENATGTNIYLYETAGDIERFSADPKDLLEDTTIRVDIWSLDGQDTARAYRNRVLSIFQEYMNDNYTRTEFLNVEPSDSTDFRQAAIARQTNHYIHSVEIAFERLVEKY